MLTNYHTLRALVAEWQETVVGSVLGEAFSQQAGELTLALAAPSTECMIRISTRPPLRFLFRIEGHSRPRRNVATCFQEVYGEEVRGLRLAHRDRIVFFDLAGGTTLEVVLFGPRANAFLVGDDGLIREAFLDDARHAGQRAPVPRAAPELASAEALSERWPAGRDTVERALSSAFPLFDRTIAAEVAWRAGVQGETPSDLDSDRIRSLHDVARAVEHELASPAPRIYWRDRKPEIISLIELSHGSGTREERFDTVDEAVRVFVKRSLAYRRFEASFGPMEKALAEASTFYRRSIERMTAELAGESRAEQYERWGHLLMAEAGRIPAGATQVELDDLFEPGTTAVIALDPARTAVENARAYYERARRNRRSREEAQNRLGGMEERARTADRLLDELRQAQTARDVAAFQARRGEELAGFLRAGRGAPESLPFRRFDLPGGYQVWVGRNARQNDELTFRHAKKYDLWMHARGVGGSHTVLRLPHRGARPSRNVLESAASIAAYFSKARGSSLVPVMVTERKFVRKPKAAPPGAVSVEREEVMLVKPGLPP